MVAGVMILFALLFGRALIEMADRLAPFDRVVWRLVLIAGVVAGGASLTIDHGRLALLQACAVGLALPVALAAWRCGVGRMPGAWVFAMAALSAFSGPAWVRWHGIEAVAAELAWLASAAGIGLALLMLGVPLLLAVSSRAFVVSTAEIEAPPKVTDAEVPDSGSTRAALLTQADTTLASSDGGGASRHVGLATPAMLLERLDHGMRRSARANVPLALLWIDVRGAPEVVRLFGDDAGEALLAEVSRRLSDALRLESTLSRTGEHCFAAVCEAVTDLDEVLAIMNTLREKLAQPCELSDGAIRIDASFGHALFTQDGTDAKTLCRIAARRARGAVRRDSRKAPMRLLDEHALTS